MNDHYMFNYTYFKLHIDHVVELHDDIFMLNAMESYVRKKVYTLIHTYHEDTCAYTQVEANSIEFFPLNAAKCVSRTLAEENLEEVKDTVDKIKKTVSEIEHKVLKLLSN